MRVARVSFRTRIWLALLGCVAVLLILTQLVVHRETARQVVSFEEQSATRASHAFDQLEQFWQDQLAQLGMRLSTSARIQAALIEGDPTLLGEVAADELAIAAISDALAAFTDLDGAPLTVLLDGTVRPAAAPVLVDPWVDRLVHAEDGHAFGYEVVDGRLFVVQATVLTLFQRPLGALLLGFPVGDEDALRLAEVIEAEICFVVESACVAATPNARGTGLGALLVRAAGRSEPRTGSWDRERWALISQPLSPSAEFAAWRVIAVPLEAVLAPFERIRRVATLAGLGALIAAGALATVLSRGLTRPVQRLVEATQRIADGEYDVRVEVAAQDEIGTLARAFTRMAEGLLLKERYRGILDKVVSPEVTEELLKGEIRLGGETRVVTTLFADIRGFTSSTEGMEPQRVITLLNDYLSRATDAVEAAGGVVDKYVGDEIIAIFGAPISRDDDPVRAVRAALAIQKALTELNLQRAGRGEPPINVGIGINTGSAVAGNMGSARRMNYTVVGEAVNLTARLCSAAAPGQILISEATYAWIRDHVAARKLPPIRVKGLSYEVQVYAVEAAHESQVRQRLARSGVAAVGVLIAVLAAATAAPAQQGPLAPTGSAADAAQALAMVPAIGTKAPFQVGLMGRIEVEGYVPPDTPTWIIEETDPFLAGRASLFGIFAFDERLSALLEARADRGHVPANRSLEVRLQQGFLHYALGTPLGLGVQAGKFISPFGMYTQRQRTPADPFVRPPLAHEHRTIVSATAIPAAIDGFLNWKDEPLPIRQRGAPLVWSVPYPTGLMLASRVHPLDVRLAVVNSAPSSAPRAWTPDFDRAPLPSLIANLGFQLRPELRLGVSYSAGPFLEAVVEESLPAGHGRRDFPQEIWNANLAFSRGLVEAHAELFVNRWEVPNLAETPRDISYYAEGKLKLLPGIYVATRYNAIHFNDMTRPSGVRERWDHDVRRWQFAGGYRLMRTSEVRAEYLLNRSDAPRETGGNLFALQWWWAF
jgi:class 3 adenylate cyclase